MASERNQADITTGCVVYVAEVRDDGVMLSRSPGASTIFVPIQDLRYDNRIPKAGEVKKGDMVIMNIIPDGSGKLVGSIVKTTNYNKIRGIVSAVIDDYLIVQYQNDNGRSEEVLIQNYVVTNLKGDVKLGDELELNMSDGRVIQAKMIERDQHEEIKEQIRKMHEEIPAPKLIEELPEKISQPVLMFKPQSDAAPDFRSFYENLPQSPQFEMASPYVQRPIPQDIFQSEVLSSQYNPAINLSQQRSLEINSSNSEMNRIVDNYTMMLQHIKFLHTEVNKLANILNNQKRMEIMNELQKSWSRYVNIPQDSVSKYKLDEILKLQNEVSNSISGINPIFESQMLPNPPLVYSNYQPQSDSNFPYPRSFTEPLRKEVPLTIPAPINIPFSQQAPIPNFIQSSNPLNISSNIQSSIIIPPQTPGRGSIINFNPFTDSSRPCTFPCSHSISQEALKNYLESQQIDTVSYLNSFTVACFDFNCKQKLSSHELCSYLGQDYISNFIIRKQAARSPPMNPYS